MRVKIFFLKRQESDNQIFHTKWDVCGHAQRDRLGQWSSFGEEVQVVQGKNQLHWLIHLNRHLRETYQCLLVMFTEYTTQSDRKLTYVD